MDFREIFWAYIRANLYAIELPPRAERLAVYSDYALADAMEEGINIGNKLERGKDIMLMANHGERADGLGSLRHSKSTLFIQSVARL